MTTEKSENLTVGEIVPLLGSIGYIVQPSPFATVQDIDCSPLTMTLKFAEVGSKEWIEIDRVNFL